jgi:pyridoxal phosphate enzyme (YggS family)
MTTISANLQAVHARIAAACAAAGRDPAGVRLLAVSKTWPAQAVREAAACGERAFGESYAQEAVAKIGALEDLGLEWHFIGPLQSNKTRPVAERFAWVHSIDRLKIAERLSAQRPAGMPPIQVCVEVNVSGEASKSGCAPEDAIELARRVAQLPNLTLRGLMAIPEPSENPDTVRARFAELRGLRDRIAAECGLRLDTLSMGMSHDLEAAIAEGATVVRVGTAIFGTREPARG